MIKIAILASGTGSNAKKLIEAAKELHHVEVCLLLTDQESAGVIDYCKSCDQAYEVVPKKGLNKQEHEEKIFQLLKQNEIDLILLAGYMRILSADFIGRFSHPKEKFSRIINIHPSLLPEHRGLNAYEQAFNSDSDFSGITLHYVDPGMDTGEIILQNKFDRLADDTIESFKARGLALEHQMYPYLLKNINENYKNYPAMELL